MSKTYFNNAVIGNSSMLGCIDSRGELVRLFWPNIDYPQHIDRFYAGVFLRDTGGGTVWFHEGWRLCRQNYMEDTNVLLTFYDLNGGNLKAVQTDYVLPDRDVLVREYEITNTGGYDIEADFVIYSSGLSTNQALLGTLYDFNYDCLIHYRHNYYISITSDMEASQFQLGNNALECAGNNRLYGPESTGMMNDGAVSWELGVLKPGEQKSITLYICASHTLKGVKALAAEAASAGREIHRERTVEYWKGYIDKAKRADTGRADVDRLYRRSLLVFKLMSDKKTGGLLAAPEIDEGFTRCGRYAYCWGRDAAFITGALDRCGLHGAVDRFYDWAAATQEEDGSWMQRYHMDGNLGPSWGLQVDETGTLIWGMLEHYKITGEISFLNRMWETVERGVRFLTKFTDCETGLPAPSFDLWEERFGEHAYSAAAVYGGIRAGAEIARLLGKDAGVYAGWSEAAERVKDAIVGNLWKEGWNRFIRSVRVKLNPWGRENSVNTVEVEVNPKGYRRDLTAEDGVIDVSLLGLSVPFKVFDADDPKMNGTAVAIINNLTACPIGGIKRYEHDGYIGGNPWVLTTLWAALFFIEKKDYGKAREYFEWAVKSRTELWLLPEQVDREKGGPAWVIPLTWSHAMFVLVLFSLLEAGELGA